MAADHGEFAFRSPHQRMQICGLGRYAYGKTTGCELPTVIEAFWVELITNARRRLRSRALQARSRLEEPSPFPN